MTGSLLPLRLPGRPTNPCMALTGDTFPRAEPEPASLEPSLPHRASALRPRGWGSPTSAGRGWGSVWRPDGGISADRTLGVQDKPGPGGLLAGLLPDPQAPSGGGSAAGFPESELASFWGFSRSGGGVSGLHECARRQLRTKPIVCRGLLSSFALEFKKSSQARFQIPTQMPPPSEGRL